MRLTCKTLLCNLFAVMPWPMSAQDLAPRAYVIKPVDSNAVTVTWSFFDGGVNINGAVPISNATGTFSTPIFSVYHSLVFLNARPTLRRHCHTGSGPFKANYCNSIVRFIVPGWSTSRRVSP